MGKWCVYSVYSKLTCGSTELTVGGLAYNSIPHVTTVINYSSGRQTGVNFNMDLVNPYATKEEAMVALHMCVTMGYLDVLDAILQIHFRTSKLSDLPSECLELLTRVAKSGSLDLLAKLLRHVDEGFLATPLRQQSLVTKLLAVAVTNGKDAMCETLIKKGGDPSGQIKGSPFLHAAVAQNHEGLVKALVDGGADVCLKDRRGETILFPVIMSNLSNKADFVSWLVSRGVDPKGTGNSGKQPIHVAAAHSPEIILRLIELDCDVNQTDVVHNDTPLHIACSRCNMDTIETLIKCGAKFNLTNNEGETPLTKLLKFAKDVYSSHSRLRMNVASKLMQYGFVCKTRDFEKKGKRKIGRDKTYELYQRLYLEPRSVPSLQHLSRAVVSDHIQPANVRKAVFSLDVPAHLKHYLMFSDYACSSTS